MLDTLRPHPPSGYRPRTRETTLHPLVSAELAAFPADSARRFAYELRTAWHDGATHVVFDPRELMGRLASELSWNAHGRPDWRIFEPLLQSALDTGSRIVAGSYERTRVHQIVAAGIHTLDADTRSRLGVGRPLSVATHDAMVREIRVSHCGHPDERRIEPMITTQRLRDAVMASALELAQLESPAVLVAGNRHVRKDCGVPAHLARRIPDATHLPFDIVHFTARTTERDSCDAIAEQLEQLKSAHDSKGGTNNASR